MHGPTSRTSTPSGVPPHDSSTHRPLSVSSHALVHPVPIPPAAHPSDLHQANALRYKHLYGFAKTPPTTVCQMAGTEGMQESVTTDGSGAEYIDFVVENPQASGIIHSSTATMASTTGTISPAADHAHFGSSSSPSSSYLSSSSFGSSALSTPGASALFSLSEAVAHEGERNVNLDSVNSNQAVSTHNIARVDEVENLDRETASEGVCTPTTNEERDSAPRKSTSSRLQTNKHVPSSSTGISTNPLHITNITSRDTIANLATASTVASADIATAGSSADAAVSPEEDEFRCSTCRHADFCAGLVMRDPTFTCGNTMTSTFLANSLAQRQRHRNGEGLPSTRVEKTPWVGERINRVVQKPEKTRLATGLRVLQGGVEYVRYGDDGDGGNEYVEVAKRSGTRRMLDVEELGKAMESASLAHPPPPPTQAGPSSASKVASRPALSHTQSRRAPRRSWNDIRVEYPASSLRTTYNSFMDPSPPRGARSTAKNKLDKADERDVRAPSRPPIEREDITNLAVAVGNNNSPTLNGPSEIATASRSRSRVKQPWKLRNAASGVLGAGDKEDEGEMFDHDDELYGVDVVERGRRRFR
ncbi:hypothetical protein QFC21_007245 [Naganishia friedmannii]|uniref:Uncharacterized protein n=1 Tax=Naganishia friedmannii TaxID=89922 RepID=A0ACC2UXG5_9TREE|nr:hypothetical protein QFC21_007245 [Naganishia friedmannii]